MILLRSALFQLYFHGFTALMLVGCLPLLALSRRYMVRAMEIWTEGVLFGLQWLVGLTMELRHAERLPKGAALIASKHQSMWDTLIFHRLVHDPAIVLKRELMYLPFYGWYARKARMIPVARGARARALKAMLRAARREAAAGRPVVVFPQGTRLAPGAAGDYKPGAAALYGALHVPCVPVALNSGLFWPRRSFRRRPGVIVVEILEPIPPGLGRGAFMHTLEARIEEASARLLEEGCRALEGGCPVKNGDKF